MEFSGYELDLLIEGLEELVLTHWDNSERTVILNLAARLEEYQKKVEYD